MNAIEAARSYMENAKEHFRLHHAGRTAEAEHWNLERSHPSYELFREAIEQASSFYSARAARELWRANVGSTLAIGLQ